MFDTNPFYDLLGFLTPAIMQTYIVLMFLAVIGGTIIDTMHKKSAQYFFENAQKAQKSARRTVTGGEKASLAVSTAYVWFAYWLYLVFLFCSSILSIFSFFFFFLR